MTDRLDRSDLKAHQETALAFLLAHPRCALWLDMGLGKTVTTLTAIALLQERLEVCRALVVAPKRVARKVWSDEAQKWSHLAHLRVVTMTGTAAQRSRARCAPADVHTINVDNLEWLTNHYRRKGEARIKRSNPWPWDLVVLDEASGFKNRETNRWKAFFRVYQHVDRIIELTGSPAPNGLVDVWAPLYFLDGGARLGRTLAAFRDRWFDKPEYGWRYIAKRHAPAQIHHSIQDVVLSMTADDTLDLPPVTENPVYVELNARERATYQRMARQHFTDVCGRTITAYNAGVAFGKCLQLANGAIYFDEEKRFETFHNHKVQALRELLGAAVSAGKSVLLFYSFWHDRVRIEALMRTRDFKRLTFRVLDTVQDEDDWNAGRIDVLAMHPASGGHGLNLQGGGETIIHFGPNPSKELTDQGNARLAGGLRRRGKHVVISTIYAEGTVDELARGLLDDKAGTHDRLMEALAAHCK